MNVAELAKSLKAKDIKNFYLIKGDDSYFKNRAADLLKGLVDDDFGQMNFDFYENEPDVWELVNACNTPPMLSDMRVVVVKDWAGKLTQAGAAAFEEYLVSPMPSTVLAIVDSGDNLKALARYAEIIDCKKASREDVERWIKIKSAKDGILFDDNAAARLADMTKSDMARVSMEVEKLTAYADKRITERDVLEMVTPELDVQIYELSNALAEGGSDKVWRVLGEIERAGMKETYILSTITSQYRRMYYASQSSDPPAAVADMLGIKPFAVTKAKEAGRKYNPVVLKKCVEMLDEQEYMFKSGKINKDNLIRDTVMKLISAMPNVQ